LYQQIKEFTWYPIEIKHSSWSLFLGGKDLDEEYPKCYIKERAFFVNDMGNVNFLFGRDTNSVYKFVDGDTHNISRFYIYDTLKREYLMTYFVPEIENKLHIFSHLGIRMLMKKIDPSILINEKDAPKNIRFDCSVEIAKRVLEGRLQMVSAADSDFYFDLNSIKLLRDNPKDCEYVFTVIRRSRQFYDIYAIVTILFATTDEGKFIIEQLDAR